MSMIYATVTGKVTAPGTDVGVPGRIEATPMVDGEFLTFPSENRSTLGPVVAQIAASGALSPSLEVPVVPGAVWRLEFIPKGSRGLKTYLGDYEITVSTDLADLVPVQIAEITETVANNIAAAAALGPTIDSATASFIRTPASQTGTAIAAITDPMKAQINAWTPTGKFKGTWSGATAYAQGDEVLHSGKRWAASAATTAGQTPGVHASWLEIPSGADVLARNQIALINSVIPFESSTTIDVRILPSTTSFPADRRGILQKPVPSVGQIKSVKVYPRFAVNPFYVELWESDGTTLTRVARTTGQSLAAAAEATITLDWWTNDASKTYYIGFQSDGGASIGYNAAGSARQTWWTNTDETSTSLTIAGMTASVAVSVYFRVDVLTAKARPQSQVLTVGPFTTGAQYTTIQQAIDAANDGPDNPVVIEVLPKLAPYPAFSMVGWSIQTGDSSTNRLRYLSIVAKGGPVTVQDTTGDYRRPPAEIRTRGLIKGIRFIATHSNPFVDPTEEAMARRSYAVHMDYGYQDVVFEDCQLISFQAPAAGIGLHQDEQITFRRCLLQSFADDAYGGLVNYGALFAHAQAGAATNQRINLHDCTIYAANGSTVLGGPSGGCAIWLAGPAAAGSVMEVNAINTKAYNRSSGSTDVVLTGTVPVTVVPHSWGNSDPLLNG